MYLNYLNKIEFIKSEFKNYYIDNGVELGPLVGTKYAGAHTHCNNCLYTITKMLKPNRVLEIGSYHFDTTNAIAKAMDENNNGRIDTLEICVGGYDHNINCKPNNKRIHDYLWYCWNSNYDLWKYTSNVEYPEFKDLTNDEIFNINCGILENILQGDKYSMVFIDGDHSFTGVSLDFKIGCKYSTEDSIQILDNVWDLRLNDVRKFYDSLDLPKWDFESWNDEHFAQDIVMDTALVLKHW